MLFVGFTALDIAQDLLAIIAYLHGVIRSQQSELDDLAQLVDDLDGEVGQLKTELAHALAAENGQRLQVDGLRQAMQNRREIELVTFEWETTGPTTEHERKWKRARGWALKWKNADGTERWCRPLNGR
jgi:hypothetical protein